MRQSEMERRHAKRIHVENCDEGDRWSGCAGGYDDGGVDHDEENPQL